MIKQLVIASGLTFGLTGYAEAITTLQFAAKFEQRRSIDIDPTGPSLGDEFPGSGLLVDSKKNTIGTFNVISFITRINANSVNRWVEAQYAFGSGSDSINIEGDQEFEFTGFPEKNYTEHFAISGGTGKYAGARGECVVALVNDTDYVVVCKFNSIKLTFPDPSTIKW